MVCKEPLAARPALPACGSKNVLSGAKHATMPYRCREKECRKRFSVKTGTVMEASNLGYQTWAIAIYLALTSLKSVSSMKLHRDLGISQKSAWHLAHRIRTAFQSGAGLFGGPVEADEMYVGGVRKNMSNAKRKELAGTGRGGSDKEAVVGVKDRLTGQVAARHVLQTDTLDVAGFVAEKTEPGATVYTDEASVYNVLKRWYHHETVKHSVSEFVNGMAHTQGIESFWSMFKRAYKGTFHKISPKHLQRYIDEFAGKHNIREADTRAQMAGVAGALTGRRLRYRELIAENGLDNGARK